MFHSPDIEQMCDSWPFQVDMVGGGGPSGTNLM